LSKIVKAGEVVLKKPVNLGEGIIDFEVSDDEINSESAKIIDAAKSEADEILREARANAKLEAERGYTEGFSKGETEGEKKGAEESQRQADAELAELKTRLEKEREEINEIKITELRKVESEIADLIFNICEKILNAKLNLDKSLIINLIRQGVQETKGDITIRVSEEYFDLVGAEFKDAEVVKDASLKGADCVIETGAGNAVCGLDEQLNALRENLYLLRDSEGETERES
jgi:flagellar biosynthesis/type III secretory pathway protein FliH